MSRKNSSHSWAYGYNEKYDFIVISKDGTVGEVYEVEGLLIGLPLEPKEVFSRSKERENQFWEPAPVPKVLSRIKTSHQWVSFPDSFKNKWTPYINEEFDRREEGYWFMSNGSPVYVTGSHYMYLQWANIDVGLPDFREANRILYIFWEACKSDPRSYGMVYVKIRRSGFSFMESSEGVNIGTSHGNARIGILSKTGPDAKKMFTDKVVPISSHYPFFFKPIQDGMDKPKTEISYRVPAVKLTKKRIKIELADEEEDEEGLNTTIDWKNTADNSYDSEKLLLLLHDESGKWEKPVDIMANWRVTKTCLRLGSKIVGKCMMGSTSNALSKGGASFKKIVDQSDVSKRNANGQTKSGLYKLFIPMEHNYEGYIDRYGMPVLRTPKKPVKGIDGEMIKIGAIDYWENEAAALADDADGLNELYRQFPRTLSHAFRDESKESLFSLTKIYQQDDYNDSVIDSHKITRGYFTWLNGVQDTKVIWNPDPKGRFYLSWIPKASLQNRVEIRNGVKYPGNEHIGTFGCDSYDISGVVSGKGSNGSLHGSTKFNMDEAPSNEFFLEYIARPLTAEIFFEEVLMACVFFGMPILAENNKPRLLYHFKNRGYRKFSMNRPDKAFNKLSKTERELGGIPNSSEDIKQSHASAIETYIEKNVGYDTSGKYRDPDEIGTMPFKRTLADWAKFDINNRTKHDASISSGLSLMGNQKHLYSPVKESRKISVTFARYNNSSSQSEILDK